MYIIIPVYNEASVVGDVIREVCKQFKNVVCIDDGSKDNTSEVIVASGGTLVRHPINLGQGAALQTGLDFALLDPKAKYFVTYDADGQHHLEDVQRMLKIIKKEKVDLVLGSRFLGRVENITRLKKLLLKAAIVFSNHTSGVPLTDTHNGLRVFNRKVAEGLQITMPDFAHASEILDRIVEKRFSYLEVPVTISYSEYSKAKGQSMINSVNVAFDMMLKKALRK